MIIAALVAVGAFLAGFHAIIAVSLFTCVRADPNMALLSPAMDGLLFFLSLAVAWVLGYFQGDAFSFHTFGTKFYGHEPTEHGYIATKWLTAAFPLLPVRSYIVITSTIQEVPHLEIERQKSLKEPFKGYFYVPQVLRTALISYGTILWCLGSLWLMFFAMCIGG